MYGGTVCAVDKASRVAALVAVFAVTLAAPAAADTFTVNTTADDGSGCDSMGPPGHPCTLRGAMSLAADNPPSTVMVPAGTYVLTGHLTLGPGVTVVGASARTTIVDANGGVTADRAFLLADPGDAALEHLTVARGRPDSGRHGGAVGGDVLVDGGGTLTLDHVRVTDGAADSGGGVAAISGSDLAIARSLFDGSNALTGSGAGGGVRVDGVGSSASVQSSTFSGNGAITGGAIASSGGAAFVLNNATVAANRVVMQGGGIAGSGTAYGSIVAGNIGESGGDLSGAGTPSNCDTQLGDAHYDVESGSDCGFADQTDRPGADPSLQPLADQGGETNTMALGEGSVARDLIPSSQCPADQRDASAPKGGGCDAGAFEADPPAPPPPPEAPHSHTIVGQVGYFGAYGLGVPYTASPNPFALQPQPRLDVDLVAASGQLLQRRTLAAPDATVFEVQPDFRFDNLPACQGCTVVLRSLDGVVQNVDPVSFNGEAGQTDAFLYYFDHPGLAVEGAILAPGMAPPNRLRVRIRNATDGRLLADTDALRPRCSSGDTAGANCKTSTGYQYRLESLPTDGRSVIFELLQSGSGGPLVVVDSAVERLFPWDGLTGAPTLTALDAVPANVRGRSLIGTVSWLAAYAPGERLDDRTSVRYAPGTHHLSVRLRDGSRVVGTSDVTAPATGDSTYRMAGLPACDRCTLELHDGPALVDRATLTLPSAASTSISRRDLQLRAIHSHFLDGVISLDAVSPADARVTVRKGDVHGPLLADSNDLPAACRTSVSDAHCDRSGVVSYRFDGMPNDTDVVVALLVRHGGSWSAVDTAATTTAGVDQDTFAPLLQVPQGFTGAPVGRQLYGFVAPLSGYAPGASPAGFKATDRYVLRLLDIHGAVVKSVTATPLSSAGSIDELRWVMNGLPACDACSVELVHGPEVQDRGLVTVSAFAPSVAAFQTLSRGRLQLGHTISGSVVATRRSARLNDLEIRIQSPGGRVFTSSSASGIAQVTCGSRNDPCPRAYSANWLIPQTPATGNWLVVARDKRTHNVLASERVAITATDEYTGTLTLKPEP